MDKYMVIGVMSGTSLDGIDVACGRFTHKEGKWAFSIEKAETFLYSTIRKKRLAELGKKSKAEIEKTDRGYGKFIGKTVLKFIEANRLQPDFVSSHGHTVFHRPEKGVTLQIGCGQAIADECALPVVCDFRTKDVALGGQGAPLVPVGDKLLFSEYDFCLNLGGFANISFEDAEGNRRAFDICPANMALNALADEFGYDYDNKGRIAASGKLNNALLDELNGLEYYRLPPPKSLGREWTEEVFFPVIEQYETSAADKLRTVCEHIAIQAGKAVISNCELRIAKLLVSGGGAYNDFLIKKIGEKCKCELVIPGKQIIEFKEALVFAFLGALRMRGEVNCLASVTGAAEDSVCGEVFQPQKLPKSK